jgi:hypothetical protein
MRLLIFAMLLCIIESILVMCSGTGGRLTPSVSDCTKKNVRVGP